MSSSLLYHACGLRGYRYQRTQYVGNDLIFDIKLSPSKWRCTECGSSNVTGRGVEERTWRTVPFGSKGAILKLDVQRVACKDCETLRQVKLGFADPRRTYTKAFERYALDLSRFMTISDTAKHLKVSWDIIKDIQKRFLAARYSQPRLGNIRYLGVDEICVGHGHRYLTVVLNMESGAVVYVGDGKGANALNDFWKRLRGSRAKVKAVAMDMSAAYIDAVSRHLPNAVIVFDRFHVVKLFNDKLSKLRRQLQNDASVTHKAVLKGTRWLLLKNPENLNPLKKEHERLKKALELNKPLAGAYYLKEDLRQVWQQPDKATAAQYFDTWVGTARALGIDIVDTLADTLEAHRSGILSWYDHHISNGPLEGLNNKIKTMQRQAYGFRDAEFFKLRIKAIHEARYVLVG